MITKHTQRWLKRQAAYVPVGTPIRTAEYEVAPIDESPAKEFVIEHHYSRSYPASMRRFGLWRRDALVGVAVFSVPMNYASLKPLPGDPKASTELGRLVLLDKVPANGESWFIARAFEALRTEGFTGVVSFSDPTARRKADGTILFPGHVGTIYQALNAIYLGRATPRTLRLLPDGRVFSHRTEQKIRAGGWGSGYSEQQLVEYGATPLRPNEDPLVWLHRWIGRLTRPVRHPGNYKYVWAFDRSAQRVMPKSQPYPKWTPLFGAEA